MTSYILSFFFVGVFREEKTECMTEVQEEFEEQKAELQKLRNEVCSINVQTHNIQ